MRGALSLVCAGLLFHAPVLAQTTPVSAGGDTGIPPALVLAPGEIHTLPVSEVVRVAVGDPEIADVTIVSPTQLLVKAQKSGTTNLILWDAHGQSELTITVVESGAEPSAIAQQMTQLLTQLNFSSVKPQLQLGKVFLLGEVANDAQLNVLEQMVSTFKGKVVNLVTVTPPAKIVEEPAPLVSLSVQVLEVNRSDLEKLGVNWSKSVALTESMMPASSVADQLFRIGRATQREGLVATINALVQQNRARILSEPRLVTASGKEASSFIGVEVPVIEATSFGTSTSSVSASIQYRQTGVLLKMTPNVQPDGQRITIHLNAEISGIDTSVGLSVPVGTQTILVPGFKSRKATTEVTAASGETVIIAGLLEAEDTNSINQVPGLGSMPVVGRLFRSPEVKSTRRELVIAVTPELVGDQGKTEDRRFAMEQALAVAEVTASVDDPRLRYALQIQDRVAKALRYPQREKELNIEGTVKLRLHLFADGTLGRAVVSESSGIESLDLEAVKAAESQAPYPGFPSQLAERELWLEIPVIFRP